MIGHARIAVWAALGAILGVAAFFGGRALHPEADAGYSFDLDAPAYEAAATAAGLSPGGFSGFGETGTLPGFTQIGGRITAVSSEAIAAEDTAGARFMVRLQGDGRIYRIEAADADSISAGASVVALLDEQGAVKGVLIDLTR